MVGRYRLYDPIAAGGMATVYFGRLLGPVGFSRTVAIKRLHPQFASNPEFVSMFLDEARLAGRVRHPNVVSTLDVVVLADELFLVMDYVQGEPLGSLVGMSARAGKKIPISHAVAIAAAALRGLHAAHEATDEMGHALGIVHRDISPQNILVGVDGVSRVLDFGVAKAAGRIQISREGQVKGKMAYMPPEQIRSAAVDRRTDVYAMGAVLWEALTCERLFLAENDVAALAKVLEGKVDPPSKRVPEIPKALDDIVLRALSRSPADRFESAREMARALEAVVPLVAVAEIGEWVEGLAASMLGPRAKVVARIEAESHGPPGERVLRPDIETRVGILVPSPAVAPARPPDALPLPELPAAPITQQVFVKLAPPAAADLPAAVAPAIAAHVAEVRLPEPVSSVSVIGVSADVPSPPRAIEVALPVPQLDVTIPSAEVSQPLVPSVSLVLDSPSVVAKPSTVPKGPPPRVLPARPSAAPAELIEEVEAFQGPEDSDAELMSRALETRFDPRRVLLVAGGVLGALFVVAVVSRLVSSPNAQDLAPPTVSSSAPGAEPPPGPASAAVGRAAPTSVPTPSSAPETSPKADSVKTTRTPSATPPADRPTRAPRPHPLDSVLDSRK